MGRENFGLCMVVVRRAFTGFLLILPTVAWAHGGIQGDHLSIGYYYGHDGSFEEPAAPPWPPTLLVDTHPWELPDISYNLAPVNSILQGWNSDLPGFEPLEPEDQETDGHGFYSWLDPNFNLGPVNVVLHLDHIDPGMSILNPATLQPLSFPAVLGTSGFHLHAVYYVPTTQNPALDQVYTATFHLSDAAGTLADSESFAVNFIITPEPATLLLMALSGTVILRHQRKA